MEQQADFREVVPPMDSDEGFLQVESPLVPDGEFIVMYKHGKIPPERQEAIKNFKAKNSNATVKEVPSRYSLKDAEDRVERLTKRLKSKGYSQFSLGIDGDDIRAVVKKKKTAGYGKEKSKGTIPKARVADILGLGDDNDDLKGLMMTLKEHDDGDIVQLDGAIYGGRLQYKWKLEETTPEGESYSISRCTTGFAVKRISDGMQGVASAAHCSTDGDIFYDPDPNEDFGNPDHYPMTPMGKHSGQYGDMQWYHTKGNQDKPEFYVSRDKKKSVHDIHNSAIMKNEVVCGYSRMTETKKCPTVLLPQVTTTDDDGITLERIVAMSNGFTTSGDSGGPWWSGNTAYGIHMGKVEVDGKYVCAWSKVKLLPKALGVVVMKEPTV